MLGFVTIFAAALAGLSGLGMWAPVACAIALASLSCAEHYQLYRREESWLRHSFEEYDASQFRRCGFIAAGGAYVVGCLFRLFSRKPLAVVVAVVRLSDALDAFGGFFTQPAELPWPTTASIREFDQNTPISGFRFAKLKGLCCRIAEFVGTQRREIVHISSLKTFPDGKRLALID